MQKRGQYRDERKEMQNWEFVSRLAATMKSDTQIAIDVRDLVKVYQKRNAPRVRAVDGISFQVRRGEIFGLLGPNGAGKTTTLKVLTTLLPPTGGTVTILGHDVMTAGLEVRKQICVVLQESAVELFLSVWNNFVTFGRFHGLSKPEIAARAKRVIELFDLGEHVDHKAIDLSGGLKRRVQVAKMFMVDKPIVFLDEATTGMDTFNKRTTLNAIKAEAVRGRTIVLTTHMLEEAEELCHSLAIINHGRIIAAGSIQQVKADALRLYYVSLTFGRLTKRLLQGLQRAMPLKMETKDSSVELTVRNHEAAMKLVQSARRLGALRHFEISSASLEDVFVELIDKKEAAT
jgi:ABC-2 type transport system ATP-binding protein